MDDEVQLKDVVVAVAESVIDTFAANKVYPADGDVPAGNDHPDGAAPNSPVDHV